MRLSLGHHSWIVPYYRLAKAPLPVRLLFLSLLSTIFICPGFVHVTGRELNAEIGSLIDDIVSSARLIVVLANSNFTENALKKKKTKRRKEKLVYRSRIALGSREREGNLSEGEDCSFARAARTRASRPSLSLSLLSARRGWMENDDSGVSRVLGKTNISPLGSQSLLGDII